MNRLLPILVLFSLILAAPASVAVTWNGFLNVTDDGSEWQRGDRITPAHMNQIDDALEEIEGEVNTLTSASGDFIEVNGAGTTSEVGFNLVEGNGIEIALDTGASPDSGTFNIQLYSGSGLIADGTGLSLRRDCTSNYVLQWNGSAWVCAEMTAGGGSNLTVDSSGSVITSPNFLTGSGDSTKLYVDFVQDGNDISGEIAMSAITSLPGLTSAILSNGTLTMASSRISFTGNGTVPCSDGGTGVIFWNGTNMMKCEGTASAEVIAGIDDVDSVLIDGTAINNLAGVGFTGTNGVEVSFGASASPGTLPDTATVQVDLNTTGPGLVADTDGLSLLRTCEDNETLVWDDVGDQWVCTASAVETYLGVVQAVSIEDRVDGDWSITADGTTNLGNTTVGGNLITLQDTDTNTLGVGAATTTSGKAEIGGEADAVQLVVQGHSTQTNDIVLVENDGGTDLLTLDNTGVLDVQSIQDIDGTNFSIAADGTAEFNNTTVEDLTSTGTLAHSGGTATLSSGATDTVALGDGADTLAGKVEIGGTQDQPQLVIEGHSTQTDSIVVVQDEVDTEVFNIENDGTVYAQSIQDMEYCQDRYNTPAAGGGEQTLGFPDGVCDLDDAGRGIVGGTTLQAGKWSISSTGRANFSVISFDGCVDERSGTNVPQTNAYSDGICDDDGVTPARGRLTFNDSGFDGTTEYVVSDGAGAGQNAGALEGTDAYISTTCLSEEGQAFAAETGCEMRMSVGRRAGIGLNVVPHLTLKDGVSLPDNALEESVTQVVVGAPIVASEVTGSTAAIAMGGKTITGAIAIDYLSTGDYLQPSAMTNKWFFINGNNIGATLTITLGSAVLPGRADQDGRSACFFAASADRIRIVSDDGADGSDIMLNGTLYTVGNVGSPSITSSGSQGDFVCLMSANPNQDSQYEWYVLGQSGTWTGTQGAN